MFSIKRFARTKNIDKNYKLGTWGTVDGKDIPEESNFYPLNRMKDPKKFYDKYNLAWYDPDDPDIFINSFKLIEPFSSRFIKQMNELDDVSKKRLEICINHLRKGEFVYTDNDKIQDNNSIYYGSDPIYYKWDTQTHFLHDRLDMNKMDELPYSKHLNDTDRLTYGVGIPELINGKYTCKIRLSNCRGHKFDNSRY